MNEIDQRIAIAKTQGFDDSNWVCANGEWCVGEEVPDYLNDLNAMHEAEQIFLNPRRMEELDCQPDNYCLHLAEVCQTRSAALLISTAAQRAEAFLKTLGLWT